MDIGLFILLIQSFPHLWNLRNKDFKNAEMKEQSWLQLAATMECTVAECQKQWKSLRDRYSKEKRALPSGSGSGGSKWEFFKALAFYDSCLVPRKRTSTTKRLPAEVKESSTSKESIEGSPWSSLQQMIPAEESLFEVNEEYEEESFSQDEPLYESQPQSMPATSASLMAVMPSTSRTSTSRISTPSTSGAATPSTSGTATPLTSGTATPSTSRTAAPVTQSGRGKKRKAAPEVTEFMDIARNLSSRVDNYVEQRPGGVNTTVTSYIREVLDLLDANRARSLRRALLQMVHEADDDYMEEMMAKKNK
ncbi:unnamed protein product [Brassicogethes aeneus]|uniref:MADF domain-containing protein n=1 Tax=Brassicogethes aeneus TaxID=1431903 RepID=A0A9P0BD10_BRAAE|nr:unnamed protein product [Brassicogethes aeneus]